MKVAALSDRGVKRSSNEDAFLRDDEEKIFIVADGIGGLADGAFASAFVVKSLYESIRGNLPASPDGVLTALSTAIMRTNSELFGKKKGSSGATAMVLCLNGSSALFAHAGDCKLYLLRDGALSQLNSEHSLVWRLWREGILPKDEMAAHPYRNVVERALGLNESIEPETGEAEVLPGDSLLIATDGVTADLSMEDISSLLNSGGVTAERLEALAALSKERGGSDNFTGILIDL